MLTFDLTPEAFEAIKGTIRITVPDAGSARRTEAAARGLGFNTHAALRAALKAGPVCVTADPGAFACFLAEASGMPGEAFLAACSVQAILAAIRRFPYIATGDLAACLGGDARSWARDDARVLAGGLLRVLARLGDPAFLRQFGPEATTTRIALMARTGPARPHDVPLAAVAALLAGLAPLADQSLHATAAFDVPLAARFPDPVDRHREFGFAFDVTVEMTGHHVLHGHGTMAEASRYADLMRASPHGTCHGHRSLSKAAWDAVRTDARAPVVDLCSEIASLEGRPYPGRPRTEERARVRDDLLIRMPVRTVSSACAPR